ncbi:hypothetical protein [Pedobacter caeni]|uniref:Uncharacterized protein n=1 Tax=Pedobacter caeni TaxID=288992 RepID=A0A1M5BXZ3_9SPHI|nr:hypothetical protein [Pedobacter caeni]SHF47286.1 hypothetical protein SAMN04488522_1021403 [Pedobacter caeni]
MKNFGCKNRIFLQCAALLLLLFITSCSKFEHRTVTDPAYLRVFNNLDYIVTLANKDEPLPYLAMLIDPQLDSKGIPIGAGIVGDFLDTRRFYAPPFPTYTGNVNASNYEFPGNADVLVAPVTNGFNLASWAQVPSGQHRIMFVLRPRTTTPFAQLEERFRKQITVDTTLNLEAKEVYTMHVLQKDFKTKENIAYLRKENFYKQGFANDRVYVNFYNLSSKGFWQAPANQKANTLGLNFTGTPFGIQDEMNIYCTLFDDLNKSSFNEKPPIPGYINQLWGTLTRNVTDASVHPYYSFPLFVNQPPEEIVSNIMPAFTFALPGLNPDQEFPGGDTKTKILQVRCNATIKEDFDYSRNFGKQPLNNLIITTHSGKNKSQSFATINTIEVVNGKIYLTSVQRTFPAPVY